MKWRSYTTSEREKGVTVVHVSAISKDEES